MAEDNSPTIPRSLGALLAEEWAIDPMSTLPSFLEMVMIADANQSARKTLESVTESLIRRLGTRSQPLEYNRDENSRVQNIFRQLRETKSFLTQRIHTILRSYAPEIRCLFLYYMERKILGSDAHSTSAESMYGSRRAKISKHGKLTDLTDVDKTRLAMILAVTPYLDEKLTQWKQNLVSRPTNHEKVATLLLEKVLPVARLCIDFGQVLVRWRFLVGQSHSFDIPSLLLGQIVRRNTREDVERQEHQANTSTTKRVPAIQSGIVACIASAVVFSWLTTMRSEMNRFRRRRRRGALQPAQQILVPPPQPQNHHALATDECRICEKNHVLPTASKSGFVFCNECLVQYLRRHGKCPVTGISSDEDSIVPLYEAFL